MSDISAVPEQAILVHVNFSQQHTSEDLSELKLLVSSAGVENAQVVTASRSAPDPKFFVGSGKAQDIADLVEQTQASVVIFNHAFSKFSQPLNNVFLWNYHMQNPIKLKWLNTSNVQRKSNG